MCLEHHPDKFQLPVPYPQLLLVFLPLPSLLFVIGMALEMLGLGIVPSQHMLFVDVKMLS